MREFTIKHRRDVAADWADKNPILHAGELGYELDTKKFKMGDGITAWADLDYYIPTAAIIELIEAHSGGSGDISEHINSPTPHPIYDNGPSLVLLYENAKV